MCDGKAAVRVSDACFAPPVQRFIRLFLAQFAHSCPADRETLCPVTLVEHVGQLAVTPLRMAFVIAKHCAPDPFRFLRWKAVRGGC